MNCMCKMHGGVSIGAGGYSPVSRTYVICVFTVATIAENYLKITSTYMISLDLLDHNLNITAISAARKSYWFRPTGLRLTISVPR